MTKTTPIAFCVALFAFSAMQAFAAPAYVSSTVNLRSAAGTTNEIVAKIPGGSLVDATNCNEGWCEVDWQGKKGFAIQSALDMSGRVPVQRAAPRRPSVTVVDEEYVPAAPPYGPPVVYYGGYRPYYYGYRPYWGYRYGYGYRRRW